MKWELWVCWVCECSVRLNGNGERKNGTTHNIYYRTERNGIPSTQNTKAQRKNYLWIWRKEEYEKQIPTHVLAFIRIIWHTLYSSPLAPSVGFSHSLCKCVIIWLCCCYVISDICYMILWNCACIHILTYSPNLLCVCTVYMQHHFIPFLSKSHISFSCCSVFLFG